MRTFLRALAMGLAFMAGMNAAVEAFGLALAFAIVGAFTLWVSDAEAEVR